MCRLSVGGIKGETWADIELNFMPSPGFIWKGPGLTTQETGKFNRTQFSNKPFESPPQWLGVESW